MIKKNSKILIIQNYNLNKGDASVVSVMIDSLKNENIIWCLTSFDPVMAKAEYKIESFDWLISFRSVKFAKNNLIKLFEISKELLWIFYSFVWIIFFKLNLRLYIPKNKKSTLKAYFDADVIILPGGHFFTNFNGFHQIFSHFWGLYFAKLIGKKTMIYAQTIGPFFGKYKYLTLFLSKLIMRNVSIITLREPDSIKYCNGLTNVYITAETVFLNKVKSDLIKNVEKYIKFESSKKEKIGLTIHHIYYKHFYSKEAYIKLMGSIIDFITSTNKYDVILIPMESTLLRVNDISFAKEIKKILINKDNFHILEEDYNPLTTSALIANMKIFIGTKTHSIVYGLKAGVPTIAIAYQQKSTEFMKLFDVENNSIELKHLTIEKFIEIFNRVEDDLNKYKNLQINTYKTVKQKAELNNTLLLSLLNEKNNIDFIEKVLFDLLNTIENEKYKGWDPYDLLSSPLIPNINVSYLLVHLQKISPINFRNLLHIKKDYITKTFAILIDSYLNLYFLYKNEIYKQRALHIYELILYKAIENDSTNLGWGRSFDFKTKGEFHDKRKPLVFLNAKIGLSILNLYTYTKDPEMLNNVQRIISSIMHNSKVITNEKGTFIGYSSEKEPRLIFNTSILVAELMLKYLNFRKIKTQIIANIDILKLSNNLIDTIINQQLKDGSWYYGLSFNGKIYKQLDFHQGFVIDSLLNIRNLTTDKSKISKIETAYFNGITFMANNQIDSNGSFLWRFPQKYPIDIHNQAQGIISLSICPTDNYNNILHNIFQFTINNFWDDKRKYFYYQKHRILKNKIHYMRWSSSWMLLALTVYLKKIK